MRRTRYLNPCPSILNPRAVIKSETNEALAGVPPLRSVATDKVAKRLLSKITHRYSLTKAQLRNVMIIQHPMNTPKGGRSDSENRKVVFLVSMTICPSVR